MNGIRLSSQLVAAALLAAPLGAAPAEERSELRPGDPIEFIYFGQNDDTALLGVGQGLEDSADGRSGVPLSFNLRVAGIEHIKPFKDPVPAAIFAAVDPQTLRLLARLNPEVPIFNLAADSDGLRAQCIPNLLHVLPSDRMRRDALDQAPMPMPGSSIVAVGWDRNLVEFGAGDLNKRFRERRRIGMTEQAWTGWVAARMFVTSLERTGLGRLGGVLEHLRTRLVYDGLKGPLLSFRENGQLRQPMILVRDGDVLGQVPGGRDAGPEELDQLGFSRCP